MPGSRPCIEQSGLIRARSIMVWLRTSGVLCEGVPSDLEVLALGLLDLVALPGIKMVLMPTGMADTNLDTTMVVPILVLLLKGPIRRRVSSERRTREKKSIRTGRTRLDILVD